MLQLSAEGLTAASMARRLGISTHTVNKHLENSYRKCGTRDRLTTGSVDSGTRPHSTGMPFVILADGDVTDSENVHGAEPGRSPSWSPRAPLCCSRPALLCSNEPAQPACRRNLQLAKQPEFHAIAPR